MNHPHAATTDPYDLSLWSDAPAAGGEEVIAWTQATGCTQPRLTIESFYLDDFLDTTLACGQSGTTPAETFSNSGTNWTPGGTVIADMPSHGVPLPNATAMGTSTLAPTTTPPFPINNMDPPAQGFSFTQSDFSTSLSDTPPLTDVGSLPSPQSDGTGDGFLPFPTFDATSPYFVQPSTLPFPQLDIAGGLDQITGAPPNWFMGGSNAGQSDYGPIIDPMNVNTTNLAPSDYAQLIDYLATPAEALTTMVTHETVPSSSLGKRSRQSDEFESGGLGRPSAIRVPGGAESMKRTRRSPATRTRSNFKCKSKATGRGAERLAPATARGVYPRSLSGLSVPQGSVGILEQEQPSKIEEREQAVMRYDTGSSAPLQSTENAEDGEDLHKIPGNLTERERLMLQTTQVDEERGAVRVIKCRLCPKPRFSTWVTFQRHCKSCEKHPSELRFCTKCGDYFGRPDSRVRHKDKKHQEACLNTSQDEAREKRQKVERLLEAFEARLKRCLRTGEDIGPRFSDIMSKKLTNTSKKVSKAEEIWVGGSSWADGLC
ncbi:hypothetical protein BJY52DRAFT_410009 [Lactarius psammicola]|nr:hypothetical protein BJY52DRAFT_410009 [Lactarius psammicola]